MKINTKAKKSTCPSLEWGTQSWVLQLDSWLQRVRVLQPLKVSLEVWRAALCDFVLGLLSFLTVWAAGIPATWLSLPHWYLGPMLYVTTRWLVTHLSFFFPIQGDWCQPGEAGTRQRPWVFCFSSGQSCCRTCWEIRSGGPSFWNGLFCALGVLFVCLFFSEDSLLADSKWSKKRNALFYLLFLR